MVSKLLLCCKKGKPYLYRQDDDSFKLENKHIYENISDYKKYYGLNNGRIVAECDFEVEEITYELYGDLDWQHDYLPTTNTMGICNLENASCLDRDEIENYLKDNKGYAIHIKNLHIFDKPRDIKNYYNIAARTMQDYMNQRALVKVPQNMCNAYDGYKNHYVLISIKPKDLCKILNGEKTIEVRKKVLKEML